MEMICLALIFFNVMFWFRFTVINLFIVKTMYYLYQLLTAVICNANRWCVCVPACVSNASVIFIADLCMCMPLSISVGEACLIGTVIHSNKLPVLFILSLLEWC